MAGNESATLADCPSSSSRMCVINHNWSARKQHLHLQSAAGISRHSVLSGDTVFENVGHRLGLAARTQISVCKSPFPSAGTAVNGSVRQRFSRDHCCRGKSKPGYRIVGSHTVTLGENFDNLSRLPVLPPSTFDVSWHHTGNASQSQSLGSVVDYAFKLHRSTKHIWYYSIPITKCKFIQC